MRERAKDRKTCQHVAVFLRVTVDESDRLEAELARREQFLCDELAGIAGADDQNALAEVVAAASHVAPASDAYEHAGKSDEKSRQERVDEYD